MKHCKNCFQTKPKAEFYAKSGRGGKYFTSYCKSCCIVKDANRRLEKQLSKFPNKYWECDICDTINIHTKLICSDCGASHGQIHSKPRL